MISDFVNQVDTVISHDADGDGDLDIFAIPEWAKKRAAWWENDGAGNFRPAVISDLSNGSAWGGMDAFAAGDFNGDGSVDIFFSDKHDAEAGEDVFQIFMSQASEADPFSFSKATLVAELPFSYFSHHVIKTADLNQDGHLDLIGNDFLILSSGLLAFEDPHFFPEFNLDLEWDQVTVANVDADEELEIIIRPWKSASLEIEILDLSNDGGVERKVIGNYLSGQTVDDIATLPGAAPGSLPFLVVKHRQQQSLDRYQVYAPDGDGFYSPNLSAQIIYDGEREYGPGFFTMGESEDLFLKTVTLDQDRIASGRLYRIHWDGITLSRELVLEEAPAFYNANPFLADLNGDGTDDLALPGSSLPRTFSSAREQLQWSAGLSEGEFSTDFRPISDVKGGATLGHVGDIDGDGDVDIVSEYSENFYRDILRVWLNDGFGNFENLSVPLGFSGGIFEPSLFSPADYANTRLIAARDLSGSPHFALASNYRKSLPAGKMDFLVRVDFPTLARSLIGWVVQDSEGSFRFLEVGWDEMCGLFYEMGTTKDLVLDWNGDGNDDLVVIAPIGLNRIPNSEWLASTYQISWKSNLRNYSAHQEIILPSIPAFPGGITLTDMDRDGDLDIFSYGDLLGRPASYWFERGPDREFLAFHELEEGLRPFGGDFDGDGHEDFINAPRSYRDISATRLFVMLSQPDMTFRKTGYDLLSLYRASPVNFRDLDGDGDLDFLSNGGTGISGLSTLSWYENRDGRYGDYFERIIITDEPRFGERDQYEMADVDGDGILDLLVSSSQYSDHLEWFKGGRATSPPSSYTSWTASHNIGGYSAGAFSDYDGDGVSNWEEFIHGSDPVRQDLDSIFRPRVFLDQGIPYFSFKRRLGFPTTSEFSPDLKTWQPLTTEPVCIPVSGDYEWVAYPLLSGESPNFFRLLIDQPSSD